MDKATGFQEKIKSAVSVRDYEGAFRLAEELMERDPSPAYRVLRDLWLNDSFEGLESEDADSPWVVFFRSAEDWRAGRDLEAIGRLHRAGAAASRHSWMRYFIAEVLLRRLDLYALARAEIKAVIRRCPWLWEARCLEAEILSACAIPGALRGITDLRVPPGSSAAFLAWRGALALWSGDYAAAIEDLDEAAAQGNPDALCWRGGAMVCLGRIEEARGDLDRLLIKDPRDPEGLIWRGEAHRLTGSFEKSRQDLDAVLSQKGDKPLAHANRALLRLKEGDIAGAREDLSRLSPPRVDQRGGRHYDFIPAFKPGQMKALLKEILRSARGCRRSDPHLNTAWMRAAGIKLPSRPAPGSRLLYWLRARGIPAAPEPPFGPDAVTEAAAAALLGIQSKSKSGAAVKEKR